MHWLTDLSMKIIKLAVLNRMKNYWRNLFSLYDSVCGKLTLKQLFWKEAPILIDFPILAVYVFEDGNENW